MSPGTNGTGGDVGQEVDLDLILELIKALAEIAAFLIPKGEKDVAAYKWQSRTWVHAGTKLRVKVDNIDDEVRLAFNDKALGKAASGQTLTKDVVIPSGENHLLLTLVNGGSGAYSFRLNAGEPGNTELLITNARARGSDSYVPGGPIHRRLFDWRIEGR
jgi:hypothetical protein